MEHSNSLETRHINIKSDFLEQEKHDGRTLTINNRQNAYPAKGKDEFIYYGGGLIVFFASIAEHMRMILINISREMKNFLDFFDDEPPDLSLDYDVFVNDYYYHHRNSFSRYWKSAKNLQEISPYVHSHFMTVTRQFS